MTIPRRTFLDSSTLQALLTYGEFIYDGGSIEPGDKIFRDPLGPEKIDALRAIMLVGQRAMFEFALSENSLKEVEASGNWKYLQWAYDVLDYWNSCVEASGLPESVNTSKLDSPSFGYLGVGDRILIKDALIFGCDAFLTMENRLPKNADHLGLHLGLRILSPIEMWKRIRPWAALYY